MPYVERHESKVVAVFANQQPGYADEEMADDHPELVAFYESPPVIRNIPKNAIWERATNAEAEAMDAMLRAQPIRLRRIYDGATHIATNHELYTMLEGALIEAFGPERAAELLAP